MIAIQGDSTPQSWLGKAQCCLDRGDLTGAEKVLLAGLHLDGRCVPALYTLGNLRLSAGDLAWAIRRYEEALQIQPDFLPAWQNLGKAFLDAGRLKAAEEAFLRIVALDPANAQACYNLGVVCYESKDAPGALARFRQALALDPGMVDAAINLAGLSLALEGPDEALPYAARAVALAPGNAAAHNALGAAQEWAGNTSAALASYQTAVRLDPDTPDLRFNLATALLMMGNWEEGWSAYEARLGTSICPARPPVAPRWEGEPLAGRRLLVLAEQGLGDTLQFCRYLARIPGRPEVVFLVQPGLGALLQGLPGASQIQEWDLRAPLPTHLDCAFQVSLLSLPGLLGTRLGAVPADVPYLRLDEVRRRSPRSLPGPGEFLRVGLVTSGNPNHSRNRFRSCPFELLRPLLELPGIRFCNLQQGAEAARITADPRILDLAPGCRDPEDLARALGSLDLLITVDTMPAHLAGALGVKVWTLLDAAPDWRWLKEGEHTPWYPTMRLFRQPFPGAWPQVVEAVRRALEEWTSSPGRSNSPDAIAP